MLAASEVAFLKSPIHGDFAQRPELTRNQIYDCISLWNAEGCFYFMTDFTGLWHQAENI